MTTMNLVSPDLAPANRFTFSDRLAPSKDSENSLLIKIAACIPVIGSVICLHQTISIERKLKEIRLPKELAVLASKEKRLPKDASPDVVKNACLRAQELSSIREDYNDAAIVNNILTAVSIYFFATTVIPLVVSVFLIGLYSLLALSCLVVKISFYNDCPYEDYLESNFIAS